MMKEIIAKIKEKKELSSISDAYIKETLDKVLRQNPKLLKSIEEGRTRSSEYSEAVKKTRAKLRVEYGMFSEELGERDEILAELRKTKEIEKKIELSNKLLGLHKSTQERMEIYPTIYDKIFAITGTPKRIIDLGCGMNPASVFYMHLGLDTIKYYASELSEKDCDFLQKYFNAMKIKGKAVPIDLKKPNLLSNLEIEEIGVREADVCFLFKVLDTIEKKGHKLAEELVKTIKAKWIAASFATHKLGGRRMEYPRRGWIERMLERLGYKFKIIEEENEIFYIICTK